MIFFLNLEFTRKAVTSMTSPLVRRSAYKQQEVLMIIKDDTTLVIILTKVNLFPQRCFASLYTFSTPVGGSISSSQSNNFVNHQLIVKIIILMKHRQVYCESVVVKQKRSLDFDGGGCWNSHRQVKRKAETELDCHRCFFLLLIFYFYFLQRQRRMI